METGSKKIFVWFLLGMLFLFAGCGRAEKECAMSGCENEAYKDGLCADHYMELTKAQNGIDSGSDKENAGEPDSAGNSGDTGMSGSGLKAGDDSETGDKSKPAGQVQFKSPYSGTTFTAVSGKASVASTVEYFTFPDANPKLKLPDIELWSGGSLVRESCSLPEDGKTGSFSYGIGSGTDGSNTWEWGKRFVELLTSKYNMKLDYEKSYSDSSTGKSKWWYLSFKKDIGVQKGLINRYEYPDYIYYDFMVYANDGSGYLSSSKPRVMVTFPGGVGFYDLGIYYDNSSSAERTKEYVNKSAEVEFYINSNGREAYQVNKFADLRSDYVTLFFYPGVYEKGTKYDFDKLLTEGEKQGKNSDVTLYVNSEEIGGDSVSNKMITVKSSEKKSFLDAYVEVVEKNDTVTAFYYYLKMVDAACRTWTLEGLVTVKAETAGDAAAAQTQGAGSGSDKDFVTCPQCHGDKFIKTTCNKSGCVNGKISCSTCKGIGTINNGNIVKTCGTCSGKKYTICTWCQGKGYTEKVCSKCGGVGKILQ